MFFGQKIHPLNFGVPEQWTVDKDAVELSGLGVRLTVRCADIADGCLRLRFENMDDADLRQHSDAVLPELREGCQVAPLASMDHVRFFAAAGHVEEAADRADATKAVAHERARANDSMTLVI